ncbi:copper resistance CopC family protein [Arthrobacter pascens]|uniref:copper resistance CopC family protein n=1 Tax=Arthrobacter pascens TaxID=1677 RepID=UPI0027D922A0|nr:copper resistance protein CopC [Arthrobacter pascens]
MATSLMLVLPGAAAQAHDTLESTDPGANSVVGSVPGKIGLTFSNTPIAIGSVIRVVDATGTDQADGQVSIVDNHVTQPVKSEAPAGNYTVTWRVVSSDGHPIEGTFTFTAGSGNTSGDTNASNSPSATSSTASTSPATASPSAASPSAAPASSSGGLPTELVMAGVVALILIAGFVALAIRIKRRLGSQDAPVDDE